MTSETIKLNLIPGGDLPVLHASQFDDGRALSFTIYDGDEPYASYAAYNISLHLRKVDGTIICIDTFTIDDVNDCVVFTTTEQMCACAGKNIGELVFTDPLSGVVVGSCNFILEVEPDPYAGGIDSASDIENLSTQIAAIVDSQLDNYYTKEEIDDQIETIVTEQVTPIVSSIVAEQVPPAVQAELGNYYTKSETDAGFYDKSEVDTLLSGKADTSDLPDMTNYYDKDTTDTLLASKANTSTTYTKTEVDNLIAAIPSTDITTEITTPASIQTFNDGGDNIPLKSLVTEILPIQAGSGVPSPQNVRAISGHSTVNVVRCGINIWSEEWVRGYYSATTGALVEATATTLASSKHIKVYPNLKIKCICPSTLTFGIFRYKLDGTYIDRITGVTSGTVITIPDDVYEIAFQIPNYGATTSYTYQNDVSLNIPDSDSQYHSYSGEQVTIPLGSTIYGGSLECVEGEGYSDGVLINLADYTGRVRAVGENDNKYFRFEELADSPDLTKRTLLLCDKFPLVEMSVNNTNIGVDIIEPSTLGYTVIAFRPPNVTQYTTQTVMDYIRTTLNGLQVCYRKATPTSLSVSGANIPTLSGVNNVYTDCGDIQSLEYFNDNADDIAAMISLMTRS